MAIDDRSRDTETGRRLAHFIAVLKARDRQNLLDVARDLWACPSYEEDLGNGPLRESYIDALFDIANIFRNIPDYRVLSPFGVNKPPLPDSVISSKSIDAWKRAYSMNDGRVREGRDSSSREAAAYHLGTIYEKAHCHYTAAFWFKQSLKDARTVGVTANILSNLTGVARNLNTIGNFVEATPYYDEILDLVEDLPPAEQVSSGLAHAAMFHLQHGDRARGESIMRTLQTEALLPRSRFFGTSSIPHWFSAALHGLGLHYIATGRARDAKTLADEVIAHADRFEKAHLVPAAMHGLTARAHINDGDLEAALAALGQVHDVNSRKAVL